MFNERPVNTDQGITLSNRVYLLSGLHFPLIQSDQGAVIDMLPRDKFMGLQSQESTITN